MPEKILVMDAQEEIRLSLADVLTSLGYSVFSADNMADGWRLFQVEAPDLVIVDVNLPVGDCLDLIKGNRGLQSKVDLIVLADAGNQAAAIDWLAKGVYDYLPKPLNGQILLAAAVRRALQTRRLTIQNSLIGNELKDCALKDSLTGLYNHQFMLKCLMDEVVRSSRYNHPFLLIIADIDGLSALNDAYGRHFGDFVLTRVARLLEDNLRLTDSTFRYSGGQFLMLLPETRKDSAVRVAERILDSVRCHDFSFEGRKALVTISMGGAEFPRESRDVPSLIELADERLDLAKTAGHDCFDFGAHGARISDCTFEN